MLTALTDDCITRFRFEGTKRGSWFTQGCSAPVPFFREFGTFKTQEGSGKQCLQSVLFKNLLIDGTVQNTWVF